MEFMHTLMAKKIQVGLIIISVMFMSNILTPASAYDYISDFSKLTTRCDAGGFCLDTECFTTTSPPKIFVATFLEVRGECSATGYLMDEISVPTSGKYMIYVKYKANGELFTAGNIYIGQNVLADLDVHLRVYDKRTGNSAPGGQDISLWHPTCSDLLSMPVKYNNIVKDHSVEVYLKANTPYLVELSATSHSKIELGVSAFSKWGPSVLQGKDPNFPMNIQWLVNEVQAGCVTEYECECTPCQKTGDRDDCDGVVILSEVIYIINRWAENKCELHDVIVAINYWANG
jgi:hypothetical protein